MKLWSLKGNSLPIWMTTLRPISLNICHVCLTLFLSLWRMEWMLTVDIFDNNITGSPQAETILHLHGLVVLVVEKVSGEAFCRDYGRWLSSPSGQGSSCRYGHIVCTSLKWLVMLVYWNCVTSLSDFSRLEKSFIENFISILHIAKLVLL